MQPLTSMWGLLAISCLVSKLQPLTILVHWADTGYLLISTKQHTNGIIKLHSSKLEDRFLGQTSAPLSPNSEHQDSFKTIIYLIAS